MPLITGATERQALIALVQALEALTILGEGGDLSFDAAIAVAAGALVQSAASTYQPETVQGLSLTPTGRVRVDTVERVAQMTMMGPWGRRSPW